MLPYSPPRASPEVPTKAVESLLSTSLSSSFGRKPSFISSEYAQQRRGRQAPSSGIWALESLRVLVVFVTWCAMVVVLWLVCYGWCSAWLYEVGPHYLYRLRAIT